MKTSPANHSIYPFERDGEIVVSSLYLAQALTVTHSKMVGEIRKLWKILQSDEPETVKHLRLFDEGLYVVINFGLFLQIFILPNLTADAVESRAMQKAFEVFRDFFCAQEDVFHLTGCRPSLNA